MTKINENNIPITKIHEAFLESKNVNLYVLREDLIHSEISGNKWRKLKYNILQAKKLRLNTILTFGGAYSNHIAATAAAGKEFGLNTVGIIRGEEVLPLNPTMQKAKENGMTFKYISRSQYRENNKYELPFIQELKREFGNFYLVPEGGSNAIALKGCSEIVDNIDVDFDVICSACGTGGTLAGIISSLKKQTKVIGFPALKGGGFLKEDINRLLTEYSIQFDLKIENNNWELNTDYHFGGYAKVKPELITFLQEFYKKHKIKLDLIYTGKMMFGLYDLIQTADVFNGKTIVVVHTGGVQGNIGFEERLEINLFS